MIGLPLVSIIMNCYNSSTFLEEAIQSVLEQTYKNWELIFWDNQSTDKSAQILKSHNDARIKYYYSQTKTSLSEARNFAIAKANGDWIAFLDCDDIWERRKLELQVQSAMKNGNVGIVYSPFSILLNTNQKCNSLYNYFRTKIKCTPHGPQKIYEKLLDRNFIVFSGVMIKTILFNNAGGFSKDLVHNEDYEILLKMSMNTYAVCLSEPLVRYRIHDYNNTYLNDDIKFKESIYIYNSLPDSFVKRQVVKRNYTRYAIFKFRQLKIKDGMNIFLSAGSFWALIQIVQFRLAVLFKRDKNDS